MSTSYKRKIITTAELQLADVVEAESTTNLVWTTCIVTQIENGQVTLFRPYGHTGEFSYTGGVIPYVGIETYKVDVDSDATWTLFQRKDLK